MNNPFQVLQLEEDATFQQIKQRYRHLTKALHPDKQPLQNYVVSKKMFEQIDQAYKSIASPLRRLVFRQYGPTALRILQDFPAEFKQYDEQHLSAEQIKELRQLMIYLLFQHDANFESDKSKFTTKAMINIKNLLVKRQDQSRMQKLNKKFPEIQNCSFEYQTILPKFYDFSNSISFQTSVQNIRKNSQYSFGVNINSVRRFFDQYMLVLQGTLSNQPLSLELGVQKTAKDGTVIRFIPLNVKNMNLANPKVSIEKSFKDRQMSFSSDFDSMSFQYALHSRKRVNYAVSSYIQTNSFSVSPRVDYQINKHLKMFVQVQIGMNMNPQEHSMQFMSAFMYGYSLILNEDLRLEIASHVTSYLQISINSPKFKISLPMIAPEVNPLRYEAIKLMIMVSTYLILEGAKIRYLKDKKFRERMFLSQQSRLIEQKRQLNRVLYNIQTQAQEKISKELRYNGLVIAKALIGEPSKINALSKRMEKFKFVNPNTIADKLEEFLNFYDTLDINLDDPMNEVQAITQILQGQVLGGQLHYFELDKLLRFNPILNEKAIPEILIAYFDRGQFKLAKSMCRGTLSLGMANKTNYRRQWMKIWNKIVSLII